MTYHAEIIAVGTELLLGNIANTDAQELSQALASVGVDVLYHTPNGWRRRSPSPGSGRTC